MRAVAFIACALAACTDTRAPITGTQSLKVDLVSPANAGSLTQRLPDAARAITLSITALDVNDQPDTSFNNSLQVYAHYLGTLSPYLGETSSFPMVPMSGGKGTLSMTLPSVFGPTTVWLDDGADPNATYATGVSPTLWYRDPFVDDIQCPGGCPATPFPVTMPNAGEMGIGALEIGPIDNKNINVSASKYGANGRLVITSVFSQGYTVADVKCQDANGTPPCTSEPYDYVEVFSYSAPLDQDRRFLSEGQVIDGFAGGITEFDGLTEIGFPQTFISGAPDINKAREPAVAVLGKDSTGAALDWFANKWMFERNEAGAIEVDNGKVCPLDSDYTTFKQWKIDPAGVADATACAGKNLINVIASGLTIDPATLVGKTVPKVVGILRPINIGSFNVWIIYPRSMADLTTN